jgi:hypothetical protein
LASCSSKNVHFFHRYNFARGLVPRGANNANSPPPDVRDRFGIHQVDGVHRDLGVIAPTSGRTGLVGGTRRDGVRLDEGGGPKTEINIPEQTPWSARVCVGFKHRSAPEMSRAHFARNERVSHYTIERLLSQGEFGDINLVRDSRKMKDSAMNEELLTSTKQAIRNEINLLADLEFAYFPVVRGSGEAIRCR